MLLIEFFSRVFYIGNLIMVKKSMENLISSQFQFLLSLMTIFYKNLQNDESAFQQE
jgi:hypothetical protein